MSEKDMADLMALVERHLGKSWTEVVDRLRDLNELDDIEERVRAGDPLGAIQGVQQAAEAFAADIHAGYVATGQATSKWLNEQATPTIRFDIQNEGAAKWAEENKLDLVSGMSQEQKQTITQVISQGIRDSRNPVEVAKDIRGTIGLAPNQADAVMSYRKALEAGDYSNALGRELSGGHSDRTIASAQDAKRALSPEQIDLAVERYRKNMVAYRAEVIARTESLRATHAGNEEAFRQAIARGDIEADSLTRTWNAAHDPRTRASHKAMDKQSRAWGEKFTSGDGVDLAYPGDPDAPIAETAQCRCVISTRMSL